MAADLQPQESQRDTFSVSVVGRPIIVNTDLSADGDFTLIHSSLDITAGVNYADALFVQLHNVSAAEIEVALSVSPASGLIANVQAAEIRVLVPAKESVWALQGETVREIDGGVGNLVAYTPGSTAGDIKVTGYVIRSRTESTYS